MSKDYKDFQSVFEGIRNVLDSVDDELSLLKQINDEQKIELKKAKRFNIFMAVIAIVSLVVSFAGFVIALN